MYAYVYCIFLCTFTGDAPLYACQPLGGYMCMRDKFLIPSTHSLTYIRSLSLSPLFFLLFVAVFIFLSHQHISFSPSPCSSPYSPTLSSLSPPPPPVFCLVFTQPHVSSSSFYFFFFFFSLSLLLFSLRILNQRIKRGYC